MSCDNERIKQWLNDPSVLENVIIVQTDISGTIRNIYGKLKLYFTDLLQVGKNLSDELFELEGYFPFQNEEIVLPNIQIEEGVWVNIDFVKDFDSVWVIFSNTTSEVEKVKNIIQKKNESYLKNKRS